MATTRVQIEPFDVGRELAKLSADRTDIGGIGAFVGVVRRDAGLAAMVLEHYPGMTEKSLAAIATEAETRWRLLACTVIHRVGTLEPGEPIVLVLAASAHREPALAATNFLIDWLKTRAPFWKRERLQSGAEHWVQARAEDDHAADRWENAQRPSK